MNKIEYEELIAFHPGYYVKDYIEDQGITQEELAKRLQTTPKYVSDLVNGRINLTDEMVLKLSIVFGTWIRNVSLFARLNINSGLNWDWLRQHELQRKRSWNYNAISRFLH